MNGSCITDLKNYNLGKDGHDVAQGRKCLRVSEPLNYISQNSAARPSAPGRTCGHTELSDLHSENSAGRGDVDSPALQQV